MGSHLLFPLEQWALRNESGRAPESEPSSLGLGFSVGLNNSQRVAYDQRAVKEDFAHQAKVLIVESKYREAINLCREGLKLHPDHLEGQVVLDMALIALQRFLDVCAEMGPVVDRDTSNIRARRILAEALGCLGDKARSRQLFKEVELLESPEQLVNDFLEREPSVPPVEIARPARARTKDGERSRPPQSYSPLPLDEQEDRPIKGHGFYPEPSPLEEVRRRSSLPSDFSPSPLPLEGEEDRPKQRHGFSPAPDSFSPSPIPFDEDADESPAPDNYSPSPIPFDEDEESLEQEASLPPSPSPSKGNREESHALESLAPLPNVIGDEVEGSPPPNSIPPPSKPLPLDSFDSSLPEEDVEAATGKSDEKEEPPASSPPAESREGSEPESKKGKSTRQKQRTAIPPPFSTPEPGARYDSVWEDSLELPSGFGTGESSRFDSESSSGKHLFEAPPDLPAELPDEFGEHLKEEGSWHRFETPPQESSHESGFPQLPDGLEIEITVPSEADESSNLLPETDFPELFDEDTPDLERAEEDDGLHPFPTWTPKPRPSGKREAKAESPTPPIADSVAQTRRSRRRHSSFEKQQKANRLLEFGYLYQRLKSGGRHEISRVESDLRGIAEEFPGTPRERQKLKLVSSWFRSLTHVMSRGTKLWPAHKIFLQLATEHAERSPLSLSAESWVSSNLQETLWLRARSRPPRPLNPACIAAVEVGGSILNHVTADDGKSAVVLVGDYDLFKNGEDWQRIVKVDIENLVAEPVDLSAKSDVDIRELHKHFEGQPARMVQGKVVALPGLELQKTYSELVLENVGVHNDELGQSPEPVAMLKDGRRIVSGTHDGVLRVWDVEVLADAAQRPIDDTWARQTIDRVKHYIKHEHKDGWLGWSSKKLATSITREREPWDTSDPLWRQNIDVWEFMNWGLVNIAFRIVSPYQISLYQRAPRRHLAAWVAAVPLVRIQQEDTVVAPDIWVARKDDLLAIETQCGTAVALQLMQGQEALDPRDLDTRNMDKMDPPAWL